MQIPRTKLLFLGAALALAACGGDGPVADGANETGGLPEIESAPPDEMSGAGGSKNAAVPAARSEAVASIPLALHGRWALAPADCAQRSDAAKGLLVVSGDGLRFYESRARPVANVESAPDFISGDFAFEGEGQSWKRFETLQLRGENLVRTESTPMETYTYVRCE